METDNTNQQVPPVQNTEPPQPPLSNPSSRSKVFIIVLGVVLVLIIGIGSYVLGTRKNQTIVQNQQPVVPTIVAQSQSLKTFQSELCPVSLKYPSDWIGGVTNSRYCQFEIGHPSDNQGTFALIILPYEKTWDDILNENQYGTAFTVAGTVGLKIEGSDATITAGDIYFHKENAIFKVVYAYPPNDTKTKAIIDDIIASIQLSEKSEDYQKLYERLQKLQKPYKDVKIKSDLAIIKSALEQYKQDKGVLPQALQALEGDYLNEIPTNPYSKQPYTYQTDGNTYTISAKLNDGSLYEVSSSSEFYRR